jgi:hypothetical protein
MENSSKNEEVMLNVTYALGKLREQLDKLSGDMILNDPDKFSNIIDRMSYTITRLSLTSKTVKDVYQLTRELGSVRLEKN